jgi:hypothetical protein
MGSIQDDTSKPRRSETAENRLQKINRPEGNFPERLKVLRIRTAQNFI